MCNAKTGKTLFFLFWACPSCKESQQNVYYKMYSIDSVERPSGQAKKKRLPIVGFPLFGFMATGFYVYGI
jgi:hypothetical protein